MDFDDEMSSLQIEDLGEYFFPNDLPNDNWKGFSLGYGDEEKPSAPTPTTKTNAASKPIAITSNNGLDSRDHSGALANSLGGISFGNMLHDASMLVSPPMLASSFSEMLKQNPMAAALGFGPGTGNGGGGGPSSTDFIMSPAGINQFNLSTPKSKDDELMELTSFTLEGRFSVPNEPSETKPLAMQRPPLNPAPASRPTLLTSSNATATCNRIMDDDDDDDDKMMMPPKRRLASSTASTPTSSTSSGSNFGSKRSFEMVDSCPGNTCATIGGNEDDRGFRKKSREKMRRQEVNVKFDELIDLLGLSNRVRKSAILQEAVSAIKSLKRERDEIRRERDRLQQEVSKLATCLQYSHLGSVAAANAVAMSQGTAGPNVHFPTPHHLNQASATAQLAQLNLTQHQLASQLPAPGCFPIGSTGFGATLTPAPTTTASAPGSTTSTTAGGISNLAATPIAPKILKPATDLKT